MSETSIEWTTTTGPDGRIHKGMTFNPWWGCEKISPGCKHCYAETFDKRWSESHWGPAHPYKLNSEAYWREPFKWNARAAKLGVRLKVFCASMADVFELRAPAELRVRLWKLIRSTPNLDWLLLTKRPEHFERFLPWVPCPTDVCKYASLSGVTCPGDDNGAHCDIEDGVGREDDGPLTCSEYRLGGETTVLGLAETSRPWPNVWLGVTAEDQKHADLRVPVLLRTPAAVRFVSYEPALERVDFSRYLKRTLVANDGERLQHPDPRVPSTGGTWDMSRVDWMICGSESGQKARPFDEDWARKVRDDCAAAHVPLFYKQKVVGGLKIGRPMLDGRQYVEQPAVHETGAAPAARARHRRRPR